MIAFFLLSSSTNTRGDFQKVSSGHTQSDVHTHLQCRGSRGYTVPPVVTWMSADNTPVTERERNVCVSCACNDKPVTMLHVCTLQVYMLILLICKDYSLRKGNKLKRGYKYLCYCYHALFFFQRQILIP